MVRLGLGCVVADLFAIVAPMSPLDLLRAFAIFAELADEIVELFALEHPELIDAMSAEAPPPAPIGDIDEDVAAAIRRGEL